MMKYKNYRKIIKLKHLAAFLANIAVIAGIVFAKFEIDQKNESQKQEFSVKVIGQTRTKEFIKTLSWIKDTYKDENVNKTKDFRDGLNYIVNTYDNIAILYSNDLVDKCIIKEAVYFAVNELSQILNYLNYPDKYRKNFDEFNKHLSKNNCN